MHLSTMLYKAAHWLEDHEDATIQWVQWQAPNWIYLVFYPRRPRWMKVFKPAVIQQTKPEPTYIRGIWDGGPVRDLPDNPLMHEPMPQGFWTAERAASFRDRGHIGHIHRLILYPAYDAKTKEALVDLDATIARLFQFFEWEKSDG